MYLVEGNIGAGKTTFLRLIQERLPQIAVVFEPVHNWQKEDYGQSLLENFYKDPARWAYTMETLTMVCRVQEHLREQEDPNPFRLMERSIYSGHYVFATNDFANKCLDALEWQIYLKWFNFLVGGRADVPQGFIYLRTDPEVAFERVKKRKRNGENTISFDYIKQVHDCHENFLLNKEGLLPELRSVPMLILNCNEEFEANSKQFAQHALDVATFVQLDRPVSEKNNTSSLMS